MNLQEGTKRIHFQSTIEMKINTVSMKGQGNWQLGEKSDPVPFLTPIISSFSPASKAPKTLSFLSFKKDRSMAVVQVVTRQSSKSSNSLQISTSELRVTNCLPHMLYSSMKNDLKLGNVKTN